MRIPKLTYTWKAALGDASGAVIAALIALPYGLAMATLMGLPPALGLFTSLLTAPITALLGKNPVLIGGTSSVTVPFIALAVKQQGIGGAAKVGLVAAVFMMVFSVLRLGRHISRVPQAVVTGFSCGIGGMMVISQLPAIFGIRTAGAWNGTMMEQLWQVLGRLNEARPAPQVLGFTVIVLATLAARLLPKAPAPLIGVAAAALFGQIFQLHEKEVGLLSLDLPPLAGFSWAPADAYTVLPAGLALAFVASVNILLTSRVVDHFRGWHRPMKKTDADAELGAYGIANVCAGMFGAPVSVGIPARSLANVRCGGTTRASNLLHAGLLALVLGAGAGVLAHIPIAALAGVTAWMGLCLLDWSTWRRLARMRRADALAFLVTAISVLLINAVAAVALGCAVFAAEWLVRRFIVLPAPVRQLQAD